MFSYTSHNIRCEYDFVNLVCASASRLRVADRRKGARNAFYGRKNYVQGKGQNLIIP